jgi:hypothetical protein
MNDILINLNIGGKKFQTYKSILVKYENLFKDLMIHVDLDKEIFIDRNSQYFEYILFFYQFGNLNHLKNTNIIEILLSEATYYCCIELVKHLEELLQKNKQTITKYCIIHEQLTGVFDDFTLFQNKVQKKLDEGFELLGSYELNGKFLIQVMIKKNIVYYIVYIYIYIFNFFFFYFF